MRKHLMLLPAYRGIHTPAWTGTDRHVTFTTRKTEKKNQHHVLHLQGRRSTCQHVTSPVPLLKEFRKRLQVFHVFLLAKVEAALSQVPGKEINIQEYY